ncbi:hypothetical protein LshimejAT787_0500070 [Lyophyllum shimeji]|uniref:Uncharacterized protein n=1 Tax=Lyophyllum shimeji TaxID=47721 RepID=A0A9P3UM99_LYOSH|nr:hypothetical protein LshimejAT787_0500070 [Lyophyllum shimeji]
MRSIPSQTTSLSSKMSKFSPAFNLGYFQAKINSLDAMLWEALTSGREDELTGQYEQVRNFWLEIRALQDEEEDTVGRIVEGSLTASVLSQFITLVNSKADHPTVVKELRQLIAPYKEARGMPPTVFKAKKGSDAAAAEGRNMDHPKPPAPPSSKPAHPASLRRDQTSADQCCHYEGWPTTQKNHTTCCHHNPPRIRACKSSSSPCRTACRTSPPPPTRPVLEPAPFIRFSDLPASKTEDWTPDADIVDEDAGLSWKKLKEKEKDGSCRDCVKRGWWCLVRKRRVEGACLACQANKRRCSNSAIREKAHAVKTEEKEVTLQPVQVVRPPSKVKSAEYIEDSDGPNMEGEQREPAPKCQPAQRARRQSTPPMQSMVSDGKPPQQVLQPNPVPTRASSPCMTPTALRWLTISHYDTQIQNVGAAATQCREKHESMREALARSEEREREARVREVELRQLVEKFSMTVRLKSFCTLVATQ